MEIKATVKWFRGAYGFLADDQGNDYFIHHTAIETPPDAPYTGVLCRPCKEAWETLNLEQCPNCKGELQKIRFRKLAELQDVLILSWSENDKGRRAERVKKL